jgi:hypothetical protein
MTSEEEEETSGRWTTSDEEVMDMQHQRRRERRHINCRRPWQALALLPLPKTLWDDGFNIRWKSKTFNNELLLSSLFVRATPMSSLRTFFMFFLPTSITLVRLFIRCRKGWAIRLYLSLSWLPYPLWHIIKPFSTTIICLCTNGP